MSQAPTTVAATANMGTPEEVSLAACTHGGHLMSWRAGGVERLWMSPLSGCGGPDAIRGGVPILFPQFGAFGPLPKHGFARTALWHVIPADPVPGAAVLALRLHDNSETRATWPTPFELTLRIVATSTWLEMTLTAVNNDDYDAVFTGGLHNYFPVSPGATITGLGGLSGWDAVTNPGRPEALEVVADVLDPTAERDLIVNDVAVPVVLHDPQRGDLTLTALGFGNRVVWNPGPNHSLGDVPRGAESGFVCIEPAAITPVSLPGLGTWVGAQRLELSR